MVKMHIITFLIFGSMCLVLAVGESVTTVRRCCPTGDRLVSDVKCERSDEKRTPQIVTNNLTKVLSEREAEEVLKRWNMIVGRPTCSVGEKEKAVYQPTFDYLVFENGSIWYLGDIIPREKFCLDESAAIICEKVEEEELSSVADSEPAQQIRKVYINKCCFDSEVYSIEESNCKSYGNVKKLTVSNFLSHTTSLNALNVSNTFFRYRFPDCRDGYINTGRLSDHNSTLQQDGSLYLPTAKVLLQPNTFCLEYLWEKPDNYPSIYTCPEFMPSPVNGSHIAPDKVDIRLIIYPPGLFLSVFFLAATLAVGCLLPTTHHMLHWRCQTCHVACLMVADFLLAVTYISGHDYPPTFCSIIAILMHVLFLAAFFWLNTMCFNIWWTFRDLRPTSLDKSQETWRLRMYELYAWGIPIIIAGTAAIIDNLPEGSLPSVLKPKFAVNNCWFLGDMEILTYFFGPVGILLFLNLVLFVLTARELTCGLWRSEVVKSTTERATLGRVCLKLVVVMGITWIADVISWAAGGPHSLWYITDILNSLHGVFIFIVVGCQPQIWSAIKRLWCFKGTASTSMNGNQQSCSQDVPSLGDSVSNNTQNTSIKVPLGETIC